MKILFVGNETPPMLSMLRSLSHEDRCYLASSWKPRSKLWSGWHRTDADFVEEVKTLADGFDAVIPTGFETAPPLVHAGCPNLPWSDWRIFRKAHDKRILSEPWSGDYPVAIKPAAFRGADQVRKCMDESEVQDAIQQLARLSSNPPLVNVEPVYQDWWSGEIRDIVMVSQDGEIWRYVAQRRVVTHPSYPHGGVGCLNQTIRDPKIANEACRIIEDLRWSGPAQLEFRYDDGEPHLLEMNAKLWGTYPLSVLAGCDFSRAIACLAEGTRLPDIDGPDQYEVGVWSAFWPVMLTERTIRSPLAWRTALSPAIRASDIAPEALSGLRAVRKWLM